MTKAEVSNLVEEGYRLDQEIKAEEKALKPKQERLEKIKEVLKACANGKEMDLLANGCKAEITFPPVTPRHLDAKTVAKARKIAGANFGKLFCLAPIKGFTDVARALLGDASEKLLAAVCGEGNGRIAFKKA